MIDLVDKTQLIDYLKSNGLYTKHSLGQNFLVDRDALDKIIEAAEIGSDDSIVEVGAGLGVVTAELVKHAGKVIAVELDEKLANLLNSEFRIQNSNLEIIYADILKVNLKDLVGGQKYKVVANIPYYITSKIIKLFLTAENKPEMIVMLVQKEVAERICAKPGEMSTLALSVQVYGEPEIVGIVPRSSFFPSPEVDSAILRIKVRDKELGTRNEKDEKEFFRLVHIGFSSKRKTLVNNLASGLRIDKKAASDIIRRVGLGENVRAQELSIDDWQKLLKELRIKN